MYTINTKRTNHGYQKKTDIGQSMNTKKYTLYGNISMKFPGWRVRIRVPGAGGFAMFY